MNNHDSYMNFLATRNPRLNPVEAEKAYSCLCCKDSGVVTDINIRQYFSAEEFSEYHWGFASSSTPVRCKASRCKGGMMRVEVRSPGEDSAPTLKTVVRYAPGTLSEVLEASHCDFIHQQEVRRLLGAKPDASDNEQAKAVFSQVKQIAVERSMERAGKAAQVIEFPGSADAPAPAFNVGDRVRFTSEKFENQAERKQVIQELGEFFNAVGIVSLCEWVSPLGHYRYHVQVGDRVAKYTEVYMAREVAV